MKYLKWSCLFLLLCQCATTGPVYTSYEFTASKISLDEIWEAYVRTYEKYFAVALTTTSPHTLTSKPKIQLKVLGGNGKIMRVRRQAFGELKQVGRDWIYSLRIMIDVDRPEQLGLEEKQLLTESLSTWTTDFQEMTVLPEDDLHPVWKSMGQDRDFEEYILEEIKERIRPKLDN
ncbi:MAG: hypothetical protein AABZ60_15220 [Planctomycetota bacterium]